MAFFTEMQTLSCLQHFDSSDSCSETGLIVKSILESGHASSKSKKCPEVSRLQFKSLSSFNCKNKENLKIKSNYFYSII